MDLIRSCYRSYMRLYPDRPDVLTAGEWHFCPPGAQVLPVKHAFGSMRWDTSGEDRTPVVGEVSVIKGWTSGAPIAGMVGQHFCGSAEVWLHGLAYAERPGLVVGPDGIPTCCAPPPLYFGELAFEGVWAEDLELYTGELAFEGEWSEVIPGGELAFEGEWYEHPEVFTGELAFQGIWDETPDVSTGELALEGVWDEGDPSEARVHANGVVVDFTFGTFVPAFTLDHDDDAYFDPAHPNGMKGTVFGRKGWTIKTTWHFAEPYTGGVFIGLTNAQTDTTVVGHTFSLTDATDVFIEDYEETGNGVRRGVSLAIFVNADVTVDVVFEVAEPR